MRPVVISRPRRVDAAAIEHALSGLPKPVAAPVVLSKVVEAAVSGSDAVRVPLVRGRAVWALAAGARSAVAEWPSALGIYDHQPPMQSLVVARAGAPDPGWERAHVVVTGERSADEADRFRARVGSARLLSKHLDQLPGMTPAFGRVSTPTFVMVAAADPVRIVTACASLRDGPVMVDAPAIPGLPGAVRFRVERSVFPSESSVLVAAVTAGGEATA